MAYTLYTQSFGPAYANRQVNIFETSTGAPATILASATGGFINDFGLATLDSAGNLSVYIDTARTWTFQVNSALGIGHLLTSPAMATGGHLSLQTASTGSNWVAFSAQPCKQITVSNQTNTSLEFRQNGAGVGLVVPSGGFYTFFGLSNANTISCRRVDTSNTQVTITARWEV